MKGFDIVSFGFAVMTGGTLVLPFVGPAAGVTAGVGLLIVVFGAQGYP